MEIYLLNLEQYFSIATLRVPQQESSAVTYLMPLEQAYSDTDTDTDTDSSNTDTDTDTYRASMWGYILPPQVSPVQ